MIVVDEAFCSCVGANIDAGELVTIDKQSGKIRPYAAGVHRWGFGVPPFSKVDAEMAQPCTASDR